MKSLIVESIGMAAMPADTLLPEIHIAVHTTLVQIHPNMLGIRQAGA